MFYFILNAECFFVCFSDAVGHAAVRGICVHLSSAHLSCLLRWVTSHTPEVCPRAVRAQTAEGTCTKRRSCQSLTFSEKEGRKKNYSAPAGTEIKALVSVGISTWSESFSSRSFKNKQTNQQKQSETMAARFLSWISLTFLLCSGSCVLAERKGTWKQLSFFPLLYVPFLALPNIYINLRETSSLVTTSAAEKERETWSCKEKFLTVPLFTPWPK